MIVIKETKTTITEKITVKVSDNDKYTVDTRKEIELAKAIIDALSDEPNLDSVTTT